jgi:uncharacterized protein YjdB
MRNSIHAALIVLFAFVSCGKSYQNDLWKDVPPKAVTGVSLKKSTTVLVGGSETLYCDFSPRDAYDRRVSWVSSNPAVASIDANGVVKGIAKGVSVITVLSVDGGFSSKCEVAVTDDKVAVTGITLDKKTLSITDGDYSKLTASLIPSNSTNQNVSWSTSDSSVATVDQGGIVHAVKPGKTVITVKSEDGGYTASCDVDVSALVMKSITLNPPVVTTVPGSTLTIQASIDPSNATDKTVLWKSSDPSVATVGNGVVNALTVGSAVITASNSDGTVKATCAVTVNSVTVTSIDISESSVNMYVGDTHTLSASILPADATDPTITWTSSDPTVASVSSSGKITALKKGAVSITAKANGGSCSDTCLVTVSAVPVSGISITDPSGSLVIPAQTGYQIVWSVSPSNAGDTSVSWLSGDTSVATVSASGYITGVTQGNAIITVKTNDGGFTAYIAVTVQSVPVTGITIPSHLTIKTGSGANTIVPNITPSSATNQTLTWSSSNTAVATVDSSGTVMPLSTGVTTLTVTSVSDPSVSATCVLTVTDGTAPGAPTLNSVTAGSNSITVNWTNPADSDIGSVKITCYIEGGSSASKTVNGTYIAAGQIFSYDVTGLTAGEVYYVYVVVTDTSGNVSAMSSEKSCSPTN